MTWWPYETSELFWVGPTCVGVLTIVLHIIGQYFSTKISFDMLEFSEPMGIKDAAKNIWTNTAVTCALLLTLVAAMIQASPFQPSGFFLEESDLVNLQQTYQAALAVSFFWHMVCIIECVVYLCYVEPLPPVDAIKFFISFPDTLGDPTTFLAVGCVFMYLAFIIWTLGNHGGMIGIMFATFFVIFTFNSVQGQWVKKAAFDPRKDDYSWLEDEPSKWPSNIPYQYKLHRNDTAMVKLVNRLGKAIKDEEVRAAAEAAAAPAAEPSPPAAPPTPAGQQQEVLMKLDVAQHSQC